MSIRSDYVTLKSSFHLVMDGFYASNFDQVSPEGQSPAPQESYFAWDIANNQPPIVLINASYFGRSYNGHWVVVVGFSSDGTTTKVILNDPDDQQKRKIYPNWIVGGSQISISLSVFGNALKYAPSDYNIAGVGPYR